MNCSSTNITHFYHFGTHGSSKIGNYGEVQEVRHRLLNKSFAVKILEKTPQNMASFEAELLIMRLLDHHNIVKFVESFISDANYFIVMDYYSGDTLEEHVKKHSAFSEYDLKKYFFQVCQAINYLHTLGVVHRDIKLDNIIFEDGNNQQVKLIDFGMAALSNGDKFQDFIGTPYYVCPEITMQ